MGLVVLRVIFITTIPSTVFLLSLYQNSLSRTTIKNQLHPPDPLPLEYVHKYPIINFRKKQSRSKNLSQLSPITIPGLSRVLFVYDTNVFSSCSESRGFVYNVYMTRP